MTTPTIQFGLGDAIRKAREAKGRTQQELASVLGFETYKTVAKMEAGKREPTVSELLTISDELEQPVEWFLSFVPTRQIPCTSDSALEELLLDVRVGHGDSRIPGPLGKAA